jgi:hypothetical protein
MAGTWVVVTEVTSNLDGSPREVSYAIPEGSADDPATDTDFDFDYAATGSVGDDPEDVGQTVADRE